MKAVVRTRYGPPGVLRLMDVEMPAPKDREVLVKVRAVSLNASDWEAPRGKPLYARIMGPFRPRHHILGSDIAGQVEAAGRNATLFQPGQDVFADILGQMGGFAEYVCVPQSALAPMPAGLTYEEAAALPQAGAIALQGIRDRGQVQPGQKVLINGAGGGSGMYAVQLQAARGRGHRGGQHGEAGIHALTGCRICPNQSAATCVMPVLSADRSRYHPAAPEGQAAARARPAVDARGRRGTLLGAAARLHLGQHSARGPACGRPDARHVCRGQGGG